MAEEQDEQDELRAQVASEKDWRAIAQMVSDLPPLPHIAMHAMKLIENPNVTTGQITGVISQDTALAARLLKISNSAMFSRRAKVTTLNQAILMVGFKTLKGIILAATLRGMSRRETQLENMVWQNSVCVAICASHFTRLLRHRFADECFTLGLLHDLGKIVLISQMPKPYAELAKQTTRGKTFFEVEQERLGYSHALLGALVAKKWNFPPEMVQVILHHHDPIEVPFADDIMLRTGIIQAADLVAHSIGIGHNEGYPDQTSEAKEVMIRIGIPMDRVDVIIEDCKRMYADHMSGGEI